MLKLNRILERRKKESKKKEIEENLEGIKTKMEHLKFIPKENKIFKNFNQDFFFFFFFFLVDLKLTRGKSVRWVSVWVFETKRWLFVCVGILIFLFSFLFLAKWESKKIQTKFKSKWMKQEIKDSKKWRIRKSCLLFVDCYLVFVSLFLSCGLPLEFFYPLR